MAYNGSSYQDDKESAVVTDKNIDAIVRTFLDEWAHPQSYAGGDVDETSDKYEDRLNVGRIRGLYTFEAKIDWDHANVDMTPAGLDAAIRARVPFIANGYTWTTQNREDGTTAVDIKGWITQDASRPFQTYASYVPQAGEQPFAERLIIGQDGLIRDDLFRSGVIRIETSAPVVLAAPSPQEAPVPTAEPASLPSAREAYPEVDAFLRQLYATGARYVSQGGASYAYQMFIANGAFSAFFVNGPAPFWGRVSTEDGRSGVASPVSYTFVDWKILEKRECRLTVQIRIQSYANITSTATYYRDTFTLVPTENASGYKVDAQQREQIPDFRTF